MITNLIDKILHLSMLFEQDIQTGMMVLVLTVSIQEQVKKSADGWSYSVKNKISYSKHHRTRSTTPSIKRVISKNKIKHQDDLK